MCIETCAHVRTRVCAPQGTIVMLSQNTCGQSCGWGINTYKYARPIAGTLLQKHAERIQHVGIYAQNGVQGMR